MLVNGVVMQFHEFLTGYDHLKREHHAKIGDWKKFYDESINRMLPSALSNGDDRLLSVGSMRAGYNQMVSEYLWFQAGKPYYKVWPQMLDTFVRTRMDVSCKLIGFPYQAFAIYLPQMDSGLDFYFEDKCYNVKCILVGCSDRYYDDVDGFKDSRRVTIWIDIGELRDGLPILSFRCAVFDDNITIEKAFDTLPIDHHSVSKGVRVPESIIEACVRLTVAVCFLATGSSKVLEYDVLSKHLDLYRSANDEKKKYYEQKAKNRGKHGWHIGRGRTDRQLDLPRGMSYAAVVEAGSNGGRRLLYQHQRCGHWHVVWFGPGRQEKRIEWFDEITVKKDLPPKPI